MKNKKILISSVFINFLLILILVFFAYKLGVISNFFRDKTYTNPQYDQRLTLFEEMGTNSADVVFIGDSLTERGEWREIFPKIESVNRGIGSDTSGGVLNRLDNVINLRPKKIFLNIGVNDLSLDVEREETLKNFQKIIDLVNTELPQSTLYIQSILPVRDNYKAVNNQEIDKLNEEIKGLTKDNNFVYVDVATSLKNKEGSLFDVYTVDGIHLTGKAYMIWSEILTDYLN